MKNRRSSDLRKTNADIVLTRIRFTETKYGKKDGKLYLCEFLNNAMLRSCNSKTLTAVSFVSESPISKQIPSSLPTSLEAH